LLVGEALQRPELRQTGALDAPFQGLLLLGVPLGTHEAQEEFVVGDLLLLGAPDLVVDDLEDFPELEVFEELFELFSHHRLCRG